MITKEPTDIPSNGNELLHPSDEGDGGSAHGVPDGCPATHGVPNLGPAPHKTNLNATSESRHATPNYLGSKNSPSPVSDIQLLESQNYSLRTEIKSQSNYDLNSQRRVPGISEVSER